MTSHWDAGGAMLGTTRKTSLRILFSPDAFLNDNLTMAFSSSPPINAGTSSGIPLTSFWWEGGSENSVRTICRILSGLLISGIGRPLFSLLPTYMTAPKGHDQRPWLTPAKPLLYTDRLTKETRYRFFQ